ncbi:HAD-IA family hydrolase [Streptomyces sp. NPDC007084]|uniref:HAD-IA family hydrolase n=1 Tax=Streptomyces sp. NPDC007084 TaxID=3154313 RepID=UPI0034557A16
MTGKRSVVFDVDDTLVNTFSTGVRKCARSASLLGLRAPSAAEIARSYGRVDFLTCVQTWHPGVDLDLYSRTYDSLADEIPVEPLCDFAHVVDEARSAGLAVGVLSNGPGAKTIRKLAAMGVTPEHLDFVEHAHTSPTPKPAPEAFTRLARRYELSPSHTWYVSDSPADWHGAEAAGWQSVAVARSGPFGKPPGAARLTVPSVDRLDRLLPVIARVPASTSAAPAAFSLDVGFTLVEHLRAPGTLIGELAVQRGQSMTDDRIDAALDDARHLLADPASVWSTDHAIDGALHAYYRAALAALGFPDGYEDVVVRHYTAPENWVLKPGAAELVRRLHRSGLPVGALGNWQSNLPLVLRRVGLLDSLVCAVSSADAGAGKPSAAAFSAVAAALGVDVREVVHIGDDVNTDVEGALRAGARAAWLPYGLSEEETCRTVTALV